MGDAAGIGPEIVIKAIAAGLPQPVVVYGDAGILQTTLHRLGLENSLTVKPIECPTSVSKPSAHCIFVLNRWDALPPALPLGEINAQAGRAAYEYVCHAIDHAQSGQIRAIVTAPLHKQAMHLGGVTYPGHTEILGERSHSKHIAMMLVNDELRVILATIHVPLAQVAKHITVASQLTTITLADQACRQAGITQPRVAVAGLNPHAGEDGRFGHEEIDYIVPAIKQAQQQGIDASGPWAGDTVFMRARRGEFDIVVAQYHDQGLIPIKYLGLDHGVNMTVGLPFVRTSVDHGTAFDIAGQGIADASSLRTAFSLAVAMTRGTP